MECYSATAAANERIARDDVLESGGRTKEKDCPPSNTVKDEQEEEDEEDEEDSMAGEATQEKGAMYKKTVPFLPSSLSHREELLPLLPRLTRFSSLSAFIRMRRSLHLWHACLYPSSTLYTYTRAYTIYFHRPVQKKRIEPRETSARIAEDERRRATSAGRTVNLRCTPGCRAAKLLHGRRKMLASSNIPLAAGAVSTIALGAAILGSPAKNCFSLKNKRQQQQQQRNPVAARTSIIRSNRFIIFHELPHRMYIGAEKQRGRSNRPATVAAGYTLTIALLLHAAAPQREDGFNNIISCVFYSKISRSPKVLDRSYSWIADASFSLNALSRAAVQTHLLEIIITTRQENIFDCWGDADARVKRVIQCTICTELCCAISSASAAPLLRAFAATPDAIDKERERVRERRRVRASSLSSLHSSRKSVCVIVAASTISSVYRVISALSTRQKKTAAENCVCFGLLDANLGHLYRDSPHNYLGSSQNRRQLTCNKRAPILATSSTLWSSSSEEQEEEEDESLIHALVVVLLDQRKSSKASIIASAQQRQQLQQASSRTVYYAFQHCWNSCVTLKQLHHQDNVFQLRC
ncbi:unnamed protein product, partial [Trichogramma brassicae]